MRTVRLGRQFDAVFIHDAVDYMATADDLRAALQTAFEHCTPGGAALVCPDHVRENFRPSTDHGGHDGDGRALRYLEWTSDPDPDDSCYTHDMAYMLRSADGTVRVEHDHATCGLFARDDWLAMLADVGFVGTAVLPFGALRGGTGGTRDVPRPPGSYRGNTRRPRRVPCGSARVNTRR